VAVWVLEKTELMVTMYRMSANIASVKPVRAGREAGWATAIFRTGAVAGTRRIKKRKTP
jgi:hypothetical protein